MYLMLQSPYRSTQIAKYVSTALGRILFLSIQFSTSAKPIFPDVFLPKFLLFPQFID